MDYLNPTFEKHLNALAYIAKTEFDIHLATEKMIFDKSHRETVLSELNHLKSGVLSKHIKLLQNTPIYIKTTVQPFFLDELPDYSMPGKNDETVIPSVKKSQSSSNKSMIIWFCGVCFVSLSLLLVWLGSQIFFTQPSRGSIYVSDSPDPIDYEVTDSDRKSPKISSEDPILSVDVQNTVSSSSPEKVAYTIQQRENKHLLETTSQVEKKTVKSNLIVALPIDQVVDKKYKSENNTPIKAIVQQQEQSNNAIFTQINTEIYSPFIKRFLLAEGIKDREPVGTISDIQFGNNSITEIYAFSQANDLMNDTLYYIWEFNGKVLARIKVGVGSNYWRSYSTKRISLSAHGDWSVTLKNQQGDVLAVSRFHY